MLANIFSKDFLWRRLHSLTGLWLVLYLFEHLLVNSRAALLIGENGSGFVKAVNAIHDLPFLPFIEIFLLGVPIVVHAYWGIKYIMTSSYNSSPSDGSRPALPEYPRNKAYTWQRITSWVLLFGIIAHVIQMRFIEYPSSAYQGPNKDYMIRLNFDKGLYTLSQRLDFTFYNQQQIEELKNRPLDLSKHPIPAHVDAAGKEAITAHHQQQHNTWLSTLEKRPLEEGQVVAVTPNIGTAELLLVRETFKMPIMLVLYTLFVLAACFHGFNGLWTFCIAWGVTLTESSQLIMRRFSTLLMILVTGLGLAAIWLTYWINLKQ